MILMPKRRRRKLKTTPSVGLTSKRSALLSYLGGFVALRSGIVTRLDIPGEDGAWIELRQLGWRHLDAARRARQTDSFDSLRAMGKDLYQMIQEARPEDTAATVADPLAMYDLGTVLELGIAAWSYPEPVNAETIGELDPETAEWAARQIVGVKEDEGDRKNG